MDSGHMTKGGGAASVQGGENAPTPSMKPCHSSTNFSFAMLKLYAPRHVGFSQVRSHIDVYRISLIKGLPRINAGSIYMPGVQALCTE